MFFYQKLLGFFVGISKLFYIGNVYDEKIKSERPG